MGREPIKTADGFGEQRQQRLEVLPLIRQRCRREGVQESGEIIHEHCAHMEKEAFLVGTNPYGIR